MKQLTLLEFLMSLQINTLVESGLIYLEASTLNWDLNNYGLLAFQRLPADRQLSILKMYVNAFQPHISL